MGGQETNHLQYVQATEPNAGYTATYIGGNITWKRKEESLKFEPMKFGIDKKATHKWNK